jgi:Epoxide hydrolase N terminus
MAASTSNEASTAVVEDPAVRPFRVEVREEDLVELCRRTAATRWSERETVANVSQGVQLATIQALARFWGTEYDLRRFEARLNAFPQFLTEIDGLRPPAPRASAMRPRWGCAPGPCTGSPVVLAAWMLDHDARSVDDIAAAFAGDPVGNLTRDEVLDNITLAWVTNTGISSRRLYWENTLASSTSRTPPCRLR